MKLRDIVKLLTISTIRCIFYPLQTINVRIKIKEHNIIGSWYHLYFGVSTTQNILC